MFLTIILLIYCVQVDENIQKEPGNHPERKNVSGCDKLSLIYDAQKSFSKRSVAFNNKCWRKGKTKRFVKAFNRRLGILLKEVLINVIILVSSTFWFLELGKQISQDEGMSNFQLLTRQGVHPNPGPLGEERKLNLSVITFNCRGLRNKEKLRGLLAKLNKLVSKGAIVALQETHTIDESYLKMYWKHKYVLNCNSRDQKGVVLLFNTDYVVEREMCDSNDRQIMVKIKNDTQSLIIANIYCPNNLLENNVFIEDVYRNLLILSHEFPDSNMILMGDLNVCVSENDFINRRHVTAERELAQHILNNNESLNLVDAYRSKISEGGYTWTRGECFSRLDYIFISRPLICTVMDCNLDWAFASSDHAAVRIDMSIPEERFGPGIPKVNTTILKDPVWKAKISDRLKCMISQIPNDWNPHIKLKYVKVAVRSAFSEVTGEAKKERFKDENMLEEELNQLILLKQKLVKNLTISSIEERERRLNNINTAIDQIRAKVNISQIRYTEELAFKARVKWFELGERSNKYFLGLLKMRQKQKFISSIICEGILYRGIIDVQIAVRKFYNNLYEKVVTSMADKEENEFFKFCPALTDDQKKYVDSPLTLEDLTLALKTCGETSPGPDGISYEVYKSFWEILSPFVLEAWLFSIDIGKLPASNLESVITLLPKEGKDTRDIKNWRPITLSNCDSKIITKAISIRVSKVLNSIIVNTQTAYVPTRSVMDNLRSNFMLKKILQ